MTKHQEKEMLHQQGLRKCSRCLEVKAEAEFHKVSKDRFGLNTACKVCVRKLNSQWQKDNLWSARERGARYRQNPEVRKTANNRSAHWGKENPEARRKSYTQWANNNPNDVASHRRNSRGRRRARMLDNPTFTVSTKDRRRLECGLCYHCGASAEHIDHIIPVARGGSHGIGNLAPMCAPCNLQKNSKLYVEFRYKREAR